jgi:hypothetical protein
MTFPTDQKIVIDASDLIQRIFDVAAELAADDAAAGVIPELNVSTTAGTGWQVADVLDYDCRYERNNRRRTIIRVVDVAQTQDEINDAKSVANPVVKRALNAFSRDIYKAVAAFELGRVTAKAQEALSVLNGGVQQGYSRDFVALRSVYNELLDLDASTDNCIISNDLEKVLIRGTDGSTFATLRPRFWRNPANRQITTLYHPKIGGLGSYSLGELFKSLARENEGLLTANDGIYCEEKLDSVELGLWATREILVNFKQIGLKAVGDEILARLTRLSDFIGPITVSGEGGESVVINPAVAQAA